MIGNIGVADTKPEVETAVDLVDPEQTNKQNNNDNGNLFVLIII